MVSTLRKTCPDLAVKAFTAIEIRHLAERIAKKPIRETLEILRAAGLQLPHRRRRGNLRSRGARQTLPWQRKAPRNGSRSIAPGTRWASAAPAPCSTATSRRPRTASTTCAACANFRTRRTASPPSCIRLRAGEQQALAPRPRPRQRVRGPAQSRHRAALPRQFRPRHRLLGQPRPAPPRRSRSATASTTCTATIQQEKIFHMAGSQTPQGQTKAKLEHAIREAGRIPMQPRHVLPPHQRAPRRRHDSARHAGQGGGDSVSNGSDFWSDVFDWFTDYLAFGNNSVLSRKPPRS